MKYLIFAFSFVLMSFATQAQWQTNLDQAKQMAVAERKFILLNFSGSDWCGPCIMTRKEIFSKPIFLDYAKANLVLLNADFPRQKKNQLSKEQQALNDQLAELYNKKGIFPYTLLLTAEGKLIKEWEGYPKQGVEPFVAELSQALDAAR